MLQMVRRFYWPQAKDTESPLQRAAQRAFSAFCVLAGASGLSVTAMNWRYVAEEPAVILTGLAIALLCLFAPLWITAHGSFRWRARALGYFCFFGMLFISQISTALVSAADILMIPCIMTFTLVLTWRDGATTAAIVFGNLSIKAAMLGSFSDQDNAASLFIALFMACVFAFVGSAIFRREIIRAMKTAADEGKRANAANKAKTVFIANISHEFRTPLNGIWGMAQVFDRQHLSPRQADQINIIEASAKSMAALVEDVLDLAKIEAGAVEIKDQPMSVSDLLKDVYASVYGSAVQKSLTLNYEVSPALPAVVHTDGNRLRQILINFAGNAVKFSDSGRILLKASEDADGWLYLACSDTGPGISASDQATIFERYHQAGYDDTKRAKGTGLGLAIAKELVERMGGKIGVDSTLGEGSTFYICVPLRPASTGRIVPDQHIVRDRPESRDRSSDPDIPGSPDRPAEPDTSAEPNATAKPDCPAGPDIISNPGPGETSIYGQPTPIGSGV